MKVGHVVEHDHGANASAADVAQGRAADVQNLFAVAVEHHVVFDLLAAHQGPAGEAAEFGIADDLLQAAAADVELLAADQFRRGPIEAEHPLVGIDGQHPFGHAGEHRLLLVPFAANGMAALLQLRGQLIERFGQRRQFIGLGHGQFVVQITLGDSPSAFADLVNRPSDARREPPACRGPGDCDHEVSADDRAPGTARLLVDFGRGDRRPHRADDAIVLSHGSSDGQ